MIRFVDGKPVAVPDDERITPMLRALAVDLNRFLAWCDGNSPEVQKLRRQYREGAVSQMRGFEWYADPDPALVIWANMCRMVNTQAGQLGLYARSTEFVRR